MSTTVFSPGTVVASTWLNDVNGLRYDNDGATHVLMTPSGTGAVARTVQSKLRDQVSVFDFLTTAQIADVQANTTTLDVTSALQAAITAIHTVGGGVLFFPRGTYKITSPLLTYGGVELRGESSALTIIKKTTNTVGSGTSRARSAAVTDSYAVDSIISVWHDDTASGTIYAYRAHINNLQLQGNANTYGIYAPRVSQTIFEDIYTLNVLVSHRTYDSWMVQYRRYTSQGVRWGIQHANDGTSLGSGTSCLFDVSWVNFDNSVQAPTYGFDLYGLTYSTLVSCGVDNATRLDTTAPYCYSFDTCIGISMVGCGAEGSSAGVILANSSRITITNLRTFAMTGNAGWGTEAAVYNAGSVLTFIGAAFAPYTSPGTMYNQIIQGGGSNKEIDSVMPSGGNTFISYGSNSKRMVESTISGQSYLIDSTGTRSIIPQLSTVTYSASMTPDMANGNEFVITATNGTAFTINAPASLPGTGQTLDITVRNASGGALGAATWNAVFKMAAWTQPANGFSRSIRFRYDGTNWVELARTTADVPN